MDPLVSILIPAYNAERWIADAIASAQAQAWKRTEIIVIDDGSSDSTLTVAQRFASSKVKVASQPNQGASVARNHALQLCHGDYIQWLDADDVLDREKIRLQMEAALLLGDDILYSSSWGSFVDDTRHCRFKPNALWQNHSPSDWLRVKMQDNLWMSIQSWLISRKLTTLAGPWNPRLRRDNDGEYFCRVIRNCREIRFVSEAKSYVRRANRYSISNNANLSDAKLRSLLDSISFHHECLLALEDSPRTRSACLAVLRRWFIYFYPEKPELVERARSMARALGADLDVPELPLKYLLIQKLFGWRVVKKILFKMPKPRALLASAYARFS